MQSGNPSNVSGSSFSDGTDLRSAEESASSAFAAGALTSSEDASFADPSTASAFADGGHSGLASAEDAMVADAGEMDASLGQAGLPTAEDVAIPGVTTESAQDLDSHSSLDPGGI